MGRRRRRMHVRFLFDRTALIVACSPRINDKSRRVAATCSFRRVSTVASDSLLRQNTVIR